MSHPSCHPAPTYLLAVLLAIPAADGHGQAATRDHTRPDTVAPTTPIPLDGAVLSGRLENGLRYVIRRNTRPEQRVELRLVVDAGSVLEDEDQRGLAHFTEHMLFNGTERFRKNDIIAYLESIGVRFGADLNAYTGFDETVYILPVPTDKPELVERSFDILQDWASGARFDSLDVVNERGVVLEEWRGGLGAGTRIRDQQFPVIFRGSRYAERLPIGSPEIVRAANPAPLRRFYREWYRPELMGIVVVGDIDPRAMEQVIRDRFSALRNPVGARARPTVDVPPNDSTLISIATDPEQQVATVSVLYKHAPRRLHTRADYRAALLAELYNRMLNARLTELSRQPEAPFAFASSDYGSFVRSTDVYQLSAAAKEGDILGALHAVLVEARRVDRHGFLPAELERAKASLLRAYEGAYQEREKTESDRLAEEYVEYLLTGAATPGIAWEYAEVQRLLPTIALEEVNALGRAWITDHNRVVAVAAPATEESRVPDEAAILRTFAAADTTTVTPYAETVSDAPLVATMPEGGRIVDESSTPSLGVTTWTLSNGVRVVLKPTDFKADEVLMRAFSPGGTSVVADADYPSALLATTAAERGGLATFDATELGKKLAGKQARANAYIDELSEGVTGGGSPKDLETLFQLVYLRFTSPRADSVAFAAFRAQVAPFFANRANSPEAVFSDSVTIVMGSNHPRAQPLSRATLDSARFGTAFAVYTDRFADASDFTFVFVGSFTLEIMRPLVERWLAALPSTKRGERWRDVGITPPGGLVEKVIRKGVEPKATTLVLFTGRTEFSPQTRHALRSVTEYVEMQLLETLREALGGTYSVSVGGQATGVPRPRYSVSIQFGSAPERADSLFGTVLAVIDSVRAGHVDDARVQKVREQQLRGLEVNVRENSYWLGNLAARLENGEDPTGLLAYESLIRGLTGAQIAEAARRFFDPARYARFVLLPEATIP